MIAITYDKQTNSVFQHFGKTQNFYLFDPNTNLKQVIDNGGFSHEGLATYLKSLGVDTLICGGLGSHAVEFLAAANIKVIYGVTGDVNKVVEDFKNGCLKANPGALHECSHHHDH